MTIPLRCAVTLLVTAVSCAGDAGTPARIKEVPTTPVALPKPIPQPVIVEPPPPLDVTLYMMSQCPYASETLLALIPQLDKLGDRVRFRTEYIGQVTEAGELKAMHGPSEIEGNIVQLCAQKIAPNWREFVRCQALDPKNIETTLRSCAVSAGVDPAPIEACALSDEGTRLLVQSFERSRVAGARGSPTLVIGGTKFAEARRSTTLFKALCDGLDEPLPPTCVDIPPPPEVGVLVLNDARCASCSEDRVRKTLMNRLDNPVFTSLDYGTPEGKALHDVLGSPRLPASVFTSLDAEQVRLLGKTLKQASDGRYFLPGAHNPVCLDEGGCKTESCRQTPFCRKDEPRVLELYMMSKCPFAAKGVTALAEVLENFERNKERVEVRLRFIGSGDAKSGFKALHGKEEVAENLRQVCVFKHYAAKNQFLRYLRCRAADLKSPDWAACTGKETGVDKALLERCSTGEDGARLLEASYKLSEDAGFGASPTWLANGRHKFSGVDAKTINEKFCEHNKLRGCDAVLSGPPPKLAAPPVP